MKISQNLTKTRKDAPKDEEAKNAQLLIRAGYIHKEMAGVYDFLPLGLKVVNNVKQIVREELDAIGGQELIMSSLQRKELWEITDRWGDDKVDVWFKSKLKNDTEVGFGWSHEEPMTQMMRDHIDSYKDLPKYSYLVQNKLRNELRAKSGIMRGREFVMKDMYSYTLDQAAHQAFYDKTVEAYGRIFDRLGIGEITYFTYASGGAFTEFSHEFQTVCEAGEDVVYADHKKGIAINEEVMTDEVMAKAGVKKEDLRQVKTAEVGNIFSFGGTKSEQLDLYFTDQDGSKKPVILGSYGIGITRLVGVITEIMADDKGLVWPVNLAPYKVIIISLGDADDVVGAASNLYQQLNGSGVDAMWDDRDARAGDKFSNAELLGIPFSIVIGGRSIKSQQVEITDRATGQMTEVAMDAVVDHTKSLCTL